MDIEQGFYIFKIKDARKKFNPEIDLRKAWHIHRF
jgi:hypothetical protein